MFGEILRPGDVHLWIPQEYFYERRRPARSVLQSPLWFYSPACPQCPGRHDPLAPGLHHFCFRVEDCAAVDAIAQRFAADGVEFSPPQLYPEYAPDYYSIFFSDPDGIRLEITNYRKERRERFEAMKQQ